MSSPRLDRPRHTRAHRRATEAGGNQAPIVDDAPATLVTST